MMTQLLVPSILTLIAVAYVALRSRKNPKTTRRITEVINAQGGCVQKITPGTWNQVTYFDCRGNLMTALARVDTLAGITWHDVHLVATAETQPNTPVPTQPTHPEYAPAPRRNT